MKRFPIAVGLFLFCALLRADLPVDVEAPETQVEVSVFDLIGKTRPPVKKDVPKLPKDYGHEVATRIESARPKLMTCLTEVDQKIEFRARVSIAGTGKGLAEEDSQAILNRSRAEQCVLGILSSLSYPKHPLKQPVIVRFPVTLQRRVL